eukprot:6262975-Amphidinium_carterae.2
MRHRPRHILRALRNLYPELEERYSEAIRYAVTVGWSLPRTAASFLPGHPLVGHQVPDADGPAQLQKPETEGAQSLSSEGSHAMLGTQPERPFTPRSTAGPAPGTQPHSTIALNIREAVPAIAPSCSP